MSERDTIWIEPEASWKMNGSPVISGNFYPFVSLSNTLRSHKLAPHWKIFHIEEASSAKLNAATTVTEIFALDDMVDQRHQHQHDQATRQTMKALPPI